MEGARRFVRPFWKVPVRDPALRSLTVHQTVVANKKNPYKKDEG